MDRNKILAALTAEERALVGESAEMVQHAPGHELVQPGDPITSVFFPVCGVVSIVNVLATGQNAAVAAVGREGMIGASVVLGMPRAMPWAAALVQVETAGLSIPAATFVRLFHELRPLRELTLLHFGRMLGDMSRAATCNRFHSHRQRLARWLVEIAQKSGERSLPLTHDGMAQILGGPRHAVTTALGELRDCGVIDYLRGQVDIIDLDRLIMAACECCEVRD